MWTSVIALGKVRFGASERSAKSRSRVLAGGNAFCESLVW